MPMIERPTDKIIITEKDFNYKKFIKSNKKVLLDSFLIISWDNFVILFTFVEKVILFLYAYAWKRDKICFSNANDAKRGK